MANPSKFFGIMFSEWGSGLSGPASVPFAVFALFATGAAQKSAYGILAIILGFFSAYRIWGKENEKREKAEDEIASLKQKYFDERPLIGIEIHSLEGPKMWRGHPVPVTFSLHHLSGRVPTAIHFEPISSLLGNFSLQFEPVPHAEKHPARHCI